MGRRLGFWRPDIRTQVRTLPFGCLKQHKQGIKFSVVLIGKSSPVPGGSDSQDELQKKNPKIQKKIWKVYLKFTYYLFYFFTFGVIRAALKKPLLVVFNYYL